MVDQVHNNGKSQGLYENWICFSWRKFQFDWKNCVFEQLQVDSN
jgi:hypothetical protein